MKETELKPCLMSKEKQIEEITELICNLYDNGKCTINGFICDHNCEYKRRAEHLYNADYRKQSEGEWLQDFDGDYYCPFCAHYPKEIINFCPNCGAKMKGE